MKLDPDLLALGPDMAALRRDIHRHPELAFEESRTLGLVVGQLRSAGLTPVEIGGGVVCVIDSGKPGPSIALRADMDALPMNDESGKPYASTTAGKAHACGHDGHTATLVGLARHLAIHRPSSGRVVLIFQPAEETGQGAAAMIAAGLLEQFPFDEVYAYHNMPLLQPGQAAVKAGAVLNGYIVWEVEIEGVGGHGAAFYKTIDPLQAAARLAVEISSLVGRYVDPAQSALITVGRLQAGTNHNIIPASASLAGTARSLSPEVLEMLYGRLEAACAGVAAMTGCTITCRKTAQVPPCVNDPRAAQIAAAACAEVLGAEGVIGDHAAFPFTDDFALFLNAAPGAYVFHGQTSAMCHNPAYDFDDELAPRAGSVFLAILQARLGA